MSGLPDQNAVKRARQAKAETVAMRALADIAALRGAPGIDAQENLTWATQMAADTYRAILAQPASSWAVAAGEMLDVWDAWFGGTARHHKAEAHQLAIAGAFAAQAYEDALNGPEPDGAPAALMRVFLVALIDPNSAALDLLRAKNRIPPRHRATNIGE